MSSEKKLREKKSSEKKSSEKKSREKKSSEKIKLTKTINNQNIDKNLLKLSKYKDSYKCIFTNTGSEPNLDFTFTNTFIKFIPYTTGSPKNDSFCLLNAVADIFAFRQNGIYDISAQNGLISNIRNIPTNGSSITCTYGREIIAPGSAANNIEVTFLNAPIKYSNANSTTSLISTDFKLNSINSASNMRMYNRFQLATPLPNNSIVNFRIGTSNDPITGDEFTSDSPNTLLTIVKKGISIEIDIKKSLFSNSIIPIIPIKPNNPIYDRNFIIEGRYISMKMSCDMNMQLTASVNFDLTNNYNTNVQVIIKCYKIEKFVPGPPPTLISQIFTSRTIQTSSTINLVTSEFQISAVDLSNKYNLYYELYIPTVVNIKNVSINTSQLIILPYANTN